MISDAVSGLVAVAACIRRICTSSVDANIETLRVVRATLTIITQAGTARASVVLRAIDVLPSITRTSRCRRRRTLAADTNLNTLTVQRAGRAVGQKALTIVA